MVNSYQLCAKNIKHHSNMIQDVGLVGNLGHLVAILYIKEIWYHRLEVVLEKNGSIKTADLEAGGTSCSQVRDLEQVFPSY